MSDYEESLEVTMTDEMAAKACAVAAGVADLVIENEIDITDVEGMVTLMVALGSVLGSFHGLWKSEGYDIKGLTDVFMMSYRSAMEEL